MEKVILSVTFKTDRRKFRRVLNRAKHLIRQARKSGCIVTESNIDVEMSEQNEGFICWLRLHGEGEPSYLWLGHVPVTVVVAK